MMAKRKFFGRYERIKFFYYLKAVWMLYIPYFIYRKRLIKILASPEAKSEEVTMRVNYYNKLTSPFSLESISDTVKISDFKLKNYKSTYYFDTLECLRYFNSDLVFRPLFGDITYVPQYPSIVKSRPIGEDNYNSVLLNLGKYRHFLFINDSIPFEAKQDGLVWRGHVSAQKQNRIDFLDKYWNHPFCNIGYTNSWNGDPRWKKGWLTIAEQLKYKFIMCLEGVDVATSLKWVMSSNSVAVSPRLRFETWFMEGTLIPDYHYILIADDFSDLDEKIHFYLNHPEKAKAIVANAHGYIQRFMNKKREKLISVLVLKKYFDMLLPTKKEKR